MSGNYRNWSLYLGLAALLTSAQLAAGIFTGRGAVEAGLPALVTVAALWFLGSIFAIAAAVVVVTAADKYSEDSGPDPRRLQGLSHSTNSTSSRKPKAGNIATWLLNTSAVILASGLVALLIDRFQNGVV